jgi:hypothetical protein
MNYCVKREYGFALVALSIMAGASMDALPADKAKSVEDWEARGGEKGSLMTRTTYALFNVTNGKYVTGDDNYDHRKLKWDDSHKPRTNPKPRFEFWRLNEKTPSPLKYGDHVAIVMPDSILFQGKPAPTYLMYVEQEKGINLEMSRGGSEQWEIHGGPTGTPVPIHAKIALYNKRAKDYVIYAERDHGINLRWNGDVNKPRDHRKK